ncbi:MAG TPA: hypothetical protein VLV15_13135, partial [Dongiaceae bacterium]|nr:hypothetical protein [Dongiaceae bacterium]
SAVEPLAAPEDGSLVLAAPATPGSEPLDRAGESATSGVPTGGPSVAAGPRVARGTSAAGVLGALGLVLGCFGLLGQGERCLVDARFRSPDATLRTYWQAMRRGDAEIVWACFTEGRDDLPVPGQLWFLPPTERLEIADLHLIPVAPGRVIVTYEVRYVPRGLNELRSFRTGDEMVRAGGEWRISRPIGDASMPDPEPITRPVDS